MRTKETQSPNYLPLNLIWWLLGETPAPGSPPAPAPGSPPAPPPVVATVEETITKAEWEAMLVDERKRVQAETKAAVEKELQGKIVAQETMDELGFKSHEELMAFLRDATAPAKEDETKKSEEIQALETRFQSEIEKLQEEVSAKEAAETQLRSELEQERIDNTILHDLEKRQVRTPLLVVNELRRFVTLNEERQPVVVNEDGELQVKTTDYIEDGVKKFKTEDKQIADLVEDFLGMEENQHFLPPSPREGSGARGGIPVDREAAQSAQYNANLDEAVKQGRGATPAFLKQWKDRYKKKSA